MYELYPYLKKTLLGLEFLSALVALFYLPKIKDTYWKWFSIYLVIIFIQEFFWELKLSFFNVSKQEYYAFFGIPIQYFFFYWLYAFKSLNNKGIFIAFTSIYLCTYIPTELFFKKINIVYSLNLTVGIILLTILIVFELKKQIITDDILKFKENKMFYINIGVVLSYIGTYPFFAFYEYISKGEHINIWNAYYLYFLIANCFMYSLFIASFIWGKHKS